MDFKKYPAVHQVEKGNTLYADVVNHCKDYKSFLVAGSKITSCHECTHGCNNDIRNQAGGKVNAFYLGKDRAVVIPEPNCHKRDAVAFIPASLRGSRYSLYVTGQVEWDSSPLYIFDEFVAYVNGVWAAIDLKRQENYVEKSRVIDGAVEFVSYGVAVLMAAEKANSLSRELLTFSRWLLRHAYNGYFEAQKEFSPFSEQDKLYQEQRDGAAGGSMRAFLKEKLGYQIPVGVEPEEDGGDVDWYLQWPPAQPTDPVARLMLACSLICPSKPHEGL